MESTNKNITAYITKYALTKGIEKIDAEICFDTCPDGHMISTIGQGYNQCFFNKEWHLYPELAAKQAEEMRLKKIKSLEKQIVKLKKMTFKTE